MAAVQQFRQLFIHKLRSSIKLEPMKYPQTLTTKEQAEQFLADLIDSRQNFSLYSHGRSKGYGVNRTNPKEQKHFETLIKQCFELTDPLVFTLCKTNLNYIPANEWNSKCSVALHQGRVLEISSGYNRTIVSNEFNTPSNR